MSRILTVTLLESPKYGEIHMVIDHGKPMFSGARVAKALHFKDARNAINKYAKEEKKLTVDINGKMKEVTFIGFQDIHRLEEMSLNDHPKELSDWLFKEFQNRKISDLELNAKNDKEVDSMELTVVEKNGVKVVDSREVAEMVEKRHGDLLRDIRGYAEIIENSTERNFALSDFFIESSYKDSTGRELPCYLVTKKGCDMIANKLTGRKGVLFTAAYVTAFENMEKRLQALTYSDNSDLSPMLQTLINIERRQNKIEAAQAEQNNKIIHIDNKVDNIRDIVAIHPDNWRNECKKIVSLIAQKRGGSDSYKDTYSEIYNLVDMRANVKLDTRLKNMRSRMERQGEKKSVCDRTNKIDVIAKDKKLKEIYIAIVKEFAIKYGVDDIPMPEDEELY